MSFLANLTLFSPLLILGLLILVVLEHADALRRGAGLRVPAVGATTSADGGDGDDGGGAEEGERERVEDTKVGEEGEEEEEREEKEREEEEEVEEEEDYEIIQYDSNDGDDDDTAGPSNAAGDSPQQPPQTPPPPPFPPPPPSSRGPPKTRNIGPKKAASLARRDQRRAYNEFQRSQALAEAETKRNLEESLAESVFAEKQRRAVVEEEIAARREKERLDRLEREKEEDRRRKEDLCRLGGAVVGGLKTGRRVWKLSELARCAPGRAEAWVKDALEREGLLGVVHEREEEVIEQEGVSGGMAGTERWQMRMITGKGYYVVVGIGDIKRLFSAIDHSGETGMSWGEMGRKLEDILGLE